jgi:hypothetical protein
MIGSPGLDSGPFQCRLGGFVGQPRCGSRLVPVRRVLARQSVALARLALQLRHLEQILSRLFLLELPPQIDRKFARPGSLDRSLGLQLGGLPRLGGAGVRRFGATGP